MSRLPKDLDGRRGCRRVGGVRQPAREPEPRIYCIVRFTEDGAPRTLRNHVTLSEAQAHCRRPDTHGVRAGRRWFCGYDYMRGCRPREGGR